MNKKSTIYSQKNQNRNFTFTVHTNVISLKLRIYWIIANFLAIDSFKIFWNRNDPPLRPYFWMELFWQRYYQLWIYSAQCHFFAPVSIAILFHSNCWSGYKTLPTSSSDLLPTWVTWNSPRIVFLVGTWPRRNRRQNLSVRIS